MPVVDKATHIGITRSDTNSARTTVDENIRKARRATYSLMGTGLHGENGLDPYIQQDLLHLQSGTTLALKVSCNNFVCHLNIFPFGITISSP
jgi:hypothetical protein